MKCIGLNGFTNIGRAAFWGMVALDVPLTVVINSPDDCLTIGSLANILTRDIYGGRLPGRLFGLSDASIEIDEQSSSLRLFWQHVILLNAEPDPSRIPWKEHCVQVVVDSTGHFVDPTIPGDTEKWGVRGHFEAGAAKVIILSQFKFNKQDKCLPDDAISIVRHINEEMYDAKRHNIISLGNQFSANILLILKPLINSFGVDSISSFSILNIRHAMHHDSAIDRFPQISRNYTAINSNNTGTLNNIIRSGNIVSLPFMREIIPCLRDVGIITNTILVPVSSGGLSVVNIVFQSQDCNRIERSEINNIYKEYSEHVFSGSIGFFSDISSLSDIPLYSRSQIFINASETHTRFFDDMNRNQNGARTVSTHAVVHGWHGDALQGYSLMLGKMILFVEVSINRAASDSVETN